MQYNVKQCLHEAQNIVYQKTMQHGIILERSTIENHEGKYKNIHNSQVKEAKLTKVQQTKTKEGIQKLYKETQKGKKETNLVGNHKKNSMQGNTKSKKKIKIIPNYKKKPKCDSKKWKRKLE